MNLENTSGNRDDIEYVHLQEEKLIVFNNHRNETSITLSYSELKDMMVLISELIHGSTMNV